MDKHFTITIHDENGVKKFNVHKLIKKFFIFFVVFIIFVGIFAAGTILYLDNNLNTIEKKRDELNKVYLDLKLKDKILQKSMKITNYRLEARKKELEELSDSLSEIERIMGLKPIDAKDLQKRVNITKLTSIQRATLLELIPSGSPVVYKGITSKFGYRTHPLLHRREYHKGIDLKATYDTPVYATADAFVEWAGYHKRSGFGNLIILMHPYGFKTYFGHLHKIVIKPGEFVKKGQLIGYTGNSGLSNGPHIHYEIRFMQRPLNPYWFIKWNQKNYKEIFEKIKQVPWQTVIEAMSRIQIVEK